VKGNLKSQPDRTRQKSRETGWCDADGGDGRSYN